MRRAAVGLGRIMRYQRPFRAKVAARGLLAVCPVTVVFVLLTLAVSAAWRDPLMGHRLAVACCAWRAADLPRGVILPLFGSAFLDRRLIEAMWTATAGWLLFGPLEAAVGGRWLVAIAAAGHVVPTVLIDLSWLAGARAGDGLSGLDVGSSAAVVTAAAALAVSYRSLPVAVLLAGGLAVDIAVAPDQATAEHLIAVAIGICGALAVRLGPGTLPRRGALAVAPGRPLGVPAEQAQGDEQAGAGPRGEDGEIAAVDGRRAAGAVLQGTAGGIDQGWPGRPRMRVTSQRGSPATEEETTPERMITGR